LETGGQTSGEIWTPPGRQASRLGALNQEQCTVYHLMRLSEYLLRWSGAAEYADYWERNLYNGLLAQGHWEGRSSACWWIAGSERGLVAYYLPLAADQEEVGQRDRGLLVLSLHARAGVQTTVGSLSTQGPVVCQYLPSGRFPRRHGGEAHPGLDPRAGDILRPNNTNREISERPDGWSVRITVEPPRPWG
jgi:hypothetical protein